MKCLLSKALDCADAVYLEGERVTDHATRRKLITLTYGDDYDYAEHINVRNTEVEISERGEGVVLTERGRARIMSFYMERPINEGDLHAQTQA